MVRSRPECRPESSLPEKHGEHLYVRMGSLTPLIGMVHLMAFCGQGRHCRRPTCAAIGFSSMTSRLVLTILLAALAAGSAQAANLSDASVRQRIDPAFRVEVNGYCYTWDNIGRCVLPGETLRLATPGYSTHSGWVASAGELLEKGSQTLWVAPADPGLYPLIATSGSVTKHVNVFVMIPYSSLKNGYLKGVRIGRYPSSTPFPNFTKPRGFIEVTPDNIDTKLSDRYTLRDLASRQPDVFPRYTVLREEILVKLELFTDLVRSKGFNFDKFTIISGYRSPFYNQRNRSGRNSAHVYGGAADIFVDCNGDGHMDDLNHDGAVNRRDSKLLAGYVDELEAQHPEIVGGCGWYSRSYSRGPFIHVDVRGKPSRWHQ